MAKEFDIYLSRRIKECDLMVFSLPFRDGLTATNRMILESCIEAYKLQKFVAVQVGSELVSHIDRMLKTCYEMLDVGTKIGADAEFQVHNSVYPEKNIIEISTADIAALTTMFTEAESVMRIGASRLPVSIGKSLGSGSSTIKVGAQLKDALKQSILHMTNTTVLEAEVAGTHSRNYIVADAPIVPVAEMVNLCYRITSAANTAMEIAAFVLGTELHFSFGRAFTGVALGSSVQGEQVQKFELIHNTLEILSELTETIIQFIEPSWTVMEITAEASSILKRHRLLVEMDSDKVLDHDSMALDEIDFVIL